MSVGLDVNVLVGVVVEVDVGIGVLVRTGLGVLVAVGITSVSVGVGVDVGVAVVVSSGVGELVSVGVRLGIDVAVDDGVGGFNPVVEVGNCNSNSSDAGSVGPVRGIITSSFVNDTLAAGYASEIILTVIATARINMILTRMLLTRIFLKTMEPSMYVQAYSTFLLHLVSFQFSKNI